MNILSLPAGGVLSLTGAGGKTSILFHLAGRLSEKGLRVLTTTTTKIHYPTEIQSKRVVLTDSIPTLLAAVTGPLARETHITAAAVPLNEKNKLKGFSPENIGEIRKSGVFDWILVEADGARHCPLKAPGEHEPVIPDCTDVWIGVVGLDVIGKNLSEENVFRAERVSGLVGAPMGEPVTPSLVAGIIAHPRGATKGVPEGAGKWIFLNKADTPEDVAAGRKIVHCLRKAETVDLDGVIIGRATDGLTVADFYDSRENRWKNG